MSWSALAATLWHAPGRTWAGMMKAAPVRLWLQAGAAVVLTVCWVGYGLVIWKGPWPLALAGKQLDLLGQGQIMGGALLLVTILCLTGMRGNFSAGKDGVRADIDREDEAPASVVTTTTTEVKP